MTAYTLLPRSDVPNHLDTGTEAQVLGVGFTVSEACTLTGIWFYSYSGATQLPLEIGLFDSSQNLVFSDSSPTFSGAVGSGWIKYNCNQSLAAGTFTAAVSNGSAPGQEWYSITSGFYTTPITNGPISCTATPCCYAETTSFVFPGTNFGAYCIFLDPEVTPAITFNTSTGADSSGTQTTSQAVTVPAGVLEGDVLLVVASQVTLLSSGSTLTATSTGTAPVQLGTTQSATVGIPATENVAVYKVIAGASEVGKTITVTSAASGFWSVALAAWTSITGSADVDVSPNGATTSGSTTVTCPTASTATAGDWAVFLCGGAFEANGTLTSGPSGSTTRLTHVSSSFVAAVISDSNGGVGVAGTSIGGGQFTVPASSNNLLAGFTVGIKSVSVGGGDSGTGGVQLPKMKLAGTGHEIVTGTGSVRLPKMKLAGTGNDNTTGTGGVKLPKMKLSGTGHESTTGTGSVRLPKMQLSGTGHEVITGTGSAKLPKMRLAGQGNAGDLSGMDAVQSMAWTVLASMDVVQDMAWTVGNGNQAMMRQMASVPWISTYPS